MVTAPSPEVGFRGWLGAQLSVWAMDVYVDRETVERVQLEKILPSRFVLAKKSKSEELDKAVLKACWVFAGEAGEPKSLPPVWRPTT